MEYLKFSKFTESDFDKMIYDAGGIRYTDKYEVKIGEKNCDYILDNAVIELKIIDENPTDKIQNKEEKLNKLAELFGRDTKTVILEPTDDNSYEYYKILSTPFKSNLKSASKQLRQSSEKLNKNNKIAILMNQGLTMTSHEEFKQIAVERARTNDSSGIDILIVCGFYYFSDKFDTISLAPFEDFHIRGEECKETVDKLRTSWNKKINNYMTQQIIDINLKKTKEPIKDLFFELNGIRYVKPPIPWGEASSFYVNGRPREDSSKDKDCLSVNKFLKIPLINSKNINHKEFKEKFENILNNRIEYNDEIKHNTLIFVEVQEIGMDKANDIAFISYVKYDEESNTTKGEWYIYGERIKFECALLLATSYCIELNAEAVYFMKNEDFKWK